MGKTLRIITLTAILIIANLACQFGQTTPNQGTLPTSEGASAPPTTAPMVLPTLIPATATNPPPQLPQVPGQVFIDDFSNRDSGWTFDYRENILADYYQGGYRISVNKDAMNVVSSLEVDHSNVRLVVDAHLIGGQDDNFFGLFCRLKDLDNFYAAVINSNGYFAILKRYQGGTLGAISSKENNQSVVINQGMALNLVEMTCIGSRITLTVNGVKLAEVTDSSLTSGDVGVFVSTLTAHSTDVLFDNFHFYLEE